jgi:hypothetical protein
VLVAFRRAQALGSPMLFSALNAFVISSLVLMLSPICSLLPPKCSQH